MHGVGGGGLGIFGVVVVVMVLAFLAWWWCWWSWHFWCSCGGCGQGIFSVVVVCIFGVVVVVVVVVFWRTFTTLSKLVVPGQKLAQNCSLMVLFGVDNPAVMSESIISDPPDAFGVLRKPFGNARTRKLNVVLRRFLDYLQNATTQEKV